VNVGELVDQLMGANDGEVDFEKDVIPEAAPVAILLKDGTILSLEKLEFVPDESFVGGTLWFHVELVR
jgi:hypothetical protein